MKGSSVYIGCGLLMAASLLCSAQEPQIQKISALEQIQAYIAEKTRDGSIDPSQESWRTRLPMFPQVEFGGEIRYAVHLETNRGDITMKFLPHAAPRHVVNFMYLVELQFYDGMAFQYIVPGQRAQGGCPIGDGRGTPGYTFEGEFESGLSHDRAGLLSMANAGRKTDGCQFFITLGPMPWMDGRHTIFGEVVEGKSVLEAIEKAGSRLGRPTNEVLIEKATISAIAAENAGEE